MPTLITCKVVVARSLRPSYSHTVTVMSSYHKISQDTTIKSSTWLQLESGARRRATSLALLIGNDRKGGLTVSPSALSGRNYHQSK